ILAQSSPSIAALLQATRTVPLVFTLVADPVGAGYVDSLAHPGGNATGFTVLEYSIAAKWLELLKEIAPRVTRVAGLRQTSLPGGPARAALRSLARPRPSHRLSAWNCVRSIRVTPARSSVPSRRSHRDRTAACL